MVIRSHGYCDFPPTEVVFWEMLLLADIGSPAKSMSFKIFRLLEVRGFLRQCPFDILDYVHLYSDAIAALHCDPEGVLKCKPSRLPKDAISSDPRE